MAHHDKSLSGRAVQAMRQRAALAAGDGKDPRIVTRGSFCDNRLKAKRKSAHASRDDVALSHLLSEFRFDWFIKSRTAPELARRCQTLLLMLQKEDEDEKRAKRRASEDAKGSSKKARR